MQVAAILRIAVATAGLALAASRTASAYPQYQLSRDQTCSGCHLSPAGGELLTENGYSVAETLSQFGTTPEFMYGKVPLPGWLALGGDLRGAAGYLKAPDGSTVLIPMQADVYAHASYRGFSLHVTVGARPAQWINVNTSPGALDHVWS